MVFLFGASLFGASLFGASRSLPPEFDPVFYRREYQDLAGLSKEALTKHYERHGRAEGRRASPADIRENFLPLAAAGGSVLEIGPFCDPVMKGQNVRYFDVLDEAGLRARAVEHKLDPTNCPAIDYVSPSGDLSVIDQQFDAVFSSHCIEHQPDLIEHLRQVERILRPGGAYFLIIPDKRYCFDHFIPEASVAEVVTAHLEKRRVHTLKNVIEHRAFTTHSDSAEHWAGRHGAELRADAGAMIQEALAEYENSRGAYIDVHAWQFTPARFRLVTASIAKLGYTALHPIRVYDTPRPRLEFMAILARAG
jgi:SAM-dependent methyltransferase